MKVNMISKNVVYILCLFVTLALFLVSTTMMVTYTLRINSMNLRQPIVLPVIQRERMELNLLPRICTMNVKSFPWKPLPSRKLEEIITDFDIICLQEMFTPFELTDAFNEYTFVRGSLTNACHQKVLPSGLVTLSKYVVISTMFVPYKNVDVFTFDKYAEKGFLITTIQLEQTVCAIINTHLQASSFEVFNPVSLEQVNELLYHINTNLNVSLVVLAGDFNITPEVLNQYHPSLKLVFSEEPTVRTRQARYDYFITFGNIDVVNVNIIQNNVSDHFAVEGTVVVLD